MTEFRRGSSDLVVAEFHIKVEGPAHRAESDARTAGRVFVEMVRRGY